MSLLIAGRRGARGKRGHKGAIMQRNISSVSDTHQLYSESNTDRRRRRKGCTVETEEPRSLCLQLEQVTDSQDSAINVFGRRSACSQNKTKTKHARYVVELIGHQTVRFEKEVGYEERRRIREKETLKATKRKLQKHSLEVRGMEAGRLRKEVKRSLKKEDMRSTEPLSLYPKKRAKKSRKQRSE